MLLRLALAYGPGGLSLRTAAAWAGISGLADLSDTAVMNRLRHAADWLGEIAGALLRGAAAVASATLDGPLGDCRHFRVLPVMRERKDLPHGSTESTAHRR